MSRIRITSCVSWINDRPLALEFDKVANPYCRKVEDLTKAEIPNRIIEVVYLMYVFDPDVIQGENGVAFDRYSKKKRAAEATIYISREEFALLDEHARLHLLARRLTQAIALIGKRVGGTGALEMESLAATLEQFHAAEILGYQPAPGDMAEAGSTAPSEQQARPDKDVLEEYQLVLQCREELLDEPGRLESLEESLDGVLSDEETLDGHDVGGGKLNLFIICAKPERTFQRLLPVLEREKVLTSLKAAYLEVDSDSYTVLWPLGVPVSFEL